MRIVQSIKQNLITASKNEKFTLTFFKLTLAMRFPSAPKPVVLTFPQAGANNLITFKARELTLCIKGIYCCIPRASMSYAIGW